MTNTQININSIAHRLAQRSPLWPCDLCQERAAVHAVHRITGATVTTAVICRVCRVEWDKEGGRG